MRRDDDGPMLGLTQLSNYLTFEGSFSAVSKPNFASKYAFESSLRDLHNALLCNVPLHRLESEVRKKNWENHPFSWDPSGFLNLNFFVKNYSTENFAVLKKRNFAKNPEFCC